MPKREVAGTLEQLTLYHVLNAVASSSTRVAPDLRRQPATCRPARNPSLNRTRSRRCSPTSCRGLLFSRSSVQSRFPPPWNRNRPRNANESSHPNYPEPHPPRTAAPIMASAQAKSKLKAFHFIPGRPTVDGAGVPDAAKENMPVEPAVHPAAADVEGEGAPEPCSTPKPVPARIAPPSTPAPRLPLADLVGNAESTNRPPRPHISPEEQLCWRAAPSPRTSQRSATPAPGTGRKRARSSSPAAPSQDDSLPHPAKRAAVRTPQADPAAELWNKYTTNKGASPSKKGLAFAHLLDGSSPHSTTNAGSVGGLRRWSSCGNEFPMSTTKRRRAAGRFRSVREEDEDQLPSTDSNAYDTVERSKLGDMVQRMRDTMAKPPSQIAPSSSTLGGALEESEENADPCHSPLQQRAQQRPAKEHTHQPAAERSSASDPSARSSLDEFGDGSLDTDLIDALEATQVSAHPVDLPVVTVPLTYPIPQDATLARAKPGSDDEFDFEDFGSAADLEHVASLYDNRSEASSPSRAEPKARAMSTTVRATSAISLMEDDSDEFGGELDADDFAAAEVAATQTHSGVRVRVGNRRGRG